MTQPPDVTALAMPERPAEALAPGTRVGELELRMREALGDGLSAVTIADAAAKSGLALDDAERALHQLGRRHGGHIAVTERGELVFRFPTGFVIDHQRRDARRVALDRIVRGATSVATWTARLALTVFLVGYSAVFFTGLVVGLVALAIASESDSPFEALGLVFYMFVDLFVEGLYWSLHPGLAGDADARALRDGESRSHLYERINRVFFGPAIAQVDPMLSRRLLTQEIRARNGRIGRSDVERVVGCAPAEAERVLSALLVDFDGKVEVSDDGAIFYEFTALRPTAQLAVPVDMPVAPAWMVPRPVPQFIGNEGGATFRIGAMWTFVTVLAALGFASGLPWYLGALPLFTALGLAAMPLVRLPSHLRRVGDALEHNGHLALLALVHSRASARQVVRADEAEHAWRGATGRAADPRALQQQLIDLGGDLEIAEDGSTAWRFAELEREQTALAAVRAEADDDERAPGAVVFRSDE